MQHRTIALVNAIRGMDRQRVVLPLIRPGGCAVVRPVVGYEAVLGGNGLALLFPIAVIHEGAVYEDDRSTYALLDVRQIGSIH